MGCPIFVSVFDISIYIPTISRFVKGGSAYLTIVAAFRCKNFLTLVSLYADAVPGVEVTYTVNFSIYDGKDTKQYTIQFLVTGKAVFEYVEDSLKELTA